MTSQGIRRARNSVQVHAPFQIRSSSDIGGGAQHRHPTSKLGVGAENLGGLRTNNVVVQFATVRFHSPHSRLLTDVKLAPKVVLKKCHIRLLDAGNKNGIAWYISSVSDP